MCVCESFRSLKLEYVSFICVIRCVAFKCVRFICGILVRVCWMSALGVIGDRVRVGVYVVLVFIEYIAGGGVLMSVGVCSKPSQYSSRLMSVVLLVYDFCLWVMLGVCVVVSSLV